MHASNEVFVGELVLGIPATAAEQHRKMPGDADSANQGDHCA